MPKGLLFPRIDLPIELIMRVLPENSGLPTAIEVQISLEEGYHNAVIG
jgi:hypothetical protein